MDNVEKNKLAMKIILIINLVLVVVCAIGCSYTIFARQGMYYTITSVMELVVLVASVLYFAMGYEKDAGSYYRMFMLLLASSYIVEIFASILDYETIEQTFTTSYTIIVSMVLYGNTLILAVGKDLGKKVSYALCAVNFVAYVIPVVGCFTRFDNFATTEALIANLVLSCSWLAIAGIAGIMTMAKYVDKAMRGSK